MILKLKKLNEKVSYYLFKMDTFEMALKLVKRNDFMASVDLRHAYYCSAGTGTKEISPFFMEREIIFLYLFAEWNLLCSEIIYEIDKTIMPL